MDILKLLVLGLGFSCVKIQNNMYMKVHIGGRDSKSYPSWNGVSGHVTGKTKDAKKRFASFTGHVFLQIVWSLLTHIIHRPSGMLSVEGGGVLQKSIDLIDCVWELNENLKGRWRFQRLLGFGYITETGNFQTHLGYFGNIRCHL